MLLRITKYFYIHFLTIAAFVFFLLNGHIYELIISYSIMFLHECAHLAAAVCIGLKVSHIAFYPFGVNLKLKNKMVDGIADEIILYSAGPAANAIMACLHILFGEHGEYYAEFFYKSNIMLFIVNILPVLPLDGGCILKKILTYYIGEKTAYKILRNTGIISALLFILLGGYIIYITGYNYSILLLSVFMLGNVFTQKQKYNSEYTRELMFYRNKRRKRTRMIVADEGEEYREISKKFIPSAYTVVCMLDTKRKVKGFKSENEIIDEILDDKFVKK